MMVTNGSAGDDPGRGSSTENGSSSVELWFNTADMSSRGVWWRSRRVEARFVATVAAILPMLSNDGVTVVFYLRWEKTTWSFLHPILPLSPWVDMQRDWTVVATENSRRQRKLQRNKQSQFLLLSLNSRHFFLDSLIRKLDEKGENVDGNHLRLDRISRR